MCGLNDAEPGSSKVQFHFAFISDFARVSSTTMGYLAFPNLLRKDGANTSKWTVCKCIWAAKTVQTVTSPWLKHFTVSVLACPWALCFWPFATRLLIYLVVHSGT